jgi:hypothetical protein
MHMVIMNRQQKSWLMPMGSIARVRHKSFDTLYHFIYIYIYIYKGYNKDVIVSKTEIVLDNLF